MLVKQGLKGRVADIFSQKKDRASEAAEDFLARGRTQRGGAGELLRRVHLRGQLLGEMEHDGAAADLVEFFLAPQDRDLPAVGEDVG